MLVLTRTTTAIVTMYTRYQRSQISVAIQNTLFSISLWQFSIKYKTYLIECTKGLSRSRAWSVNVIHPFVCPSSNSYSLWCHGSLLRGCWCSCFQPFTQTRNCNRIKNTHFPHERGQSFWTVRTLQGLQWVTSCYCCSGWMGLVRRGVITRSRILKDKLIHSVSGFHSFVKWQN